MIFYKRYLKSTGPLYFLALLVLFVSILSSQAAAISQAQKDSIKSGARYFNTDASCSDSITGSNDTTVSVSPGQGQADGAAFPKLDPAAMATAINKWIQKENPSSKLKGLGSTIVASAKNSNVSPFLIVAIAHEESSLSNPSDFNVSHGNNSFGRAATPSQPHFVGARLWYKWSSVKASVDYTAPENKNAAGGGDMATYLRKQYGNSIDKGSLTTLFLTYAPPSENNTTQYIQNVKGWINDLIDLTGQGAAPSDQAGSTTTIATCCDTSSSMPAASGSISPNAGNGMSSSAQSKFQQILVAAGQKFNVDPNFIASFYYAENARTHDSTNNGDSAQPPPVTGDGNWREPPSPFGNGAAWIRNSFTASGPFQFIDSTWRAYGVDGNGDGKVDVNNLADAAFAAAKYLAASGGKANTSDAGLRRAAFAYNHSSTYGDSVLNTFHYLSGGGQSSVDGSASSCSAGSSSAAGEFTNPFPGGWIPNRLDMGYDGTFKDKIVAPFAGTITYASTSFSNWGGYMEIRADNKPDGLPTSTLYFAEGIKPLVNSGHVDAGQPIATGAPSPYGNAYGTDPGGVGEIEWGVAQDGPKGAPTNTYVYGKCGQGSARQSVLDFLKWAQQTLKVSGQPTTTGGAGCP